MAFKKYIPEFLLPTEEPAHPVRIYDVPLRRELFHKARPGNEVTVSASRNNSVVYDRRRSNASEAAHEQRRGSWHPGMIFDNYVRV